MQRKPKLGDTTLKVYLTLLRHGKAMSIAEVQKALGFRSPGTAHYHLERLVDLNLAKRVPGGYVAQPNLPRRVAMMYIILRKILLPRHIPHAVFFTVFLLSYLMLNIDSLDPSILIILAIPTILYWLDVYHEIKLLD
ncbi:MAG: hypothetical protein DRJ63_07935 [Thermoprotei archaeon]|nr:MAG: hypothetical protein DRJ63_07935 [Thermoprotei archaeon]